MRRPSTHPHHPTLPLCCLQVGAVRQPPGWSDSLRVDQWIRVALNQGALLSSLQLLSLFPMITKYAAVGKPPHGGKKLIDFWR